MLEAQTLLQQQKPVHLVILISALYISFLALASFSKFAARWITVGLGTRKVPVAPGGNWLLGHVIPLATSCAWEKMHEWVRGSPPLVRFRILHRTGIVVGDPLAVKRIFQVWKIASHSQKLCLSIGGGGDFFIFILETFFSPTTHSLTDHFPPYSLSRLDTNCTTRISISPTNLSFPSSVLALSPPTETIGRSNAC